MTVICISAFLCLAVMPITSLFITFRPTEQLLQQNYIERASSLYSNLSLIYNIDNKLARAHFLLFALRRIFYVAIAWCFTSVPMIQIILLTHIQQAVLIYQGLVRPGADRQLNRLDLFNEWTVLLSTQLIVVFTEWQSDQLLKF